MGRLFNPILILSGPLTLKGEVTSIKITDDGNFILAISSSGLSYLWQSAKSFQKEIEKFEQIPPELLKELRAAGARLYPEN